MTGPRGPIAQRAARGLFYTLLFALPFSQAAIEIIFPLLLICWIAGWLPRNAKPRSLWALGPAQTVLFSLLVYAAVCTWSVSFSSYPKLSLVGLIGKTYEYILLFFIISDIGRDPETAHRGLTTLLWSALLVCLYALIQQTVGIALLQKGDHEVHQHILRYGRMVGPYKNPNNLATYLMVVATVTAAQIMAQPKRARYGLWGLATLLVVCLAFTQSKGAYTGFMVGLILLAVFNSQGTRKPALGTGAVILLLSGAVILLQKGYLAKILTLSDAGSQERSVMWNTAWRMIQDKPIWGHGINTFMANYLTYVTGPNQGPAYAHNCFLQITAENGLVGLAFFLWFLIALFALLRVSLKKSPGPPSESPTKPWLAGLAAGLIAFLIQSMFDTNLYALRQATLFWTVAGIAVGLSVHLLDNDELGTTIR